MTELCLCSHVQGFHHKDATGERTRNCYMPACGCKWFRAASRPGPEAVQDVKSAATGDEAA